MSNVPHPKGVANETIHAIEKVSNGNDLTLLSVVESFAGNPYGISFISIFLKQINNTVPSI